jgi:hypothetical protein
VIGCVGLVCAAGGAAKLSAEAAAAARPASQCSIDMEIPSSLLGISL